MKIAFAGTPEVAAKVLDNLALRFEVAMVITRPDAQKGRDRAASPSAVATLAEKLGLQTTKTNHITEVTLRDLEAKGTEKVVVVAFGARIPKVALQRIKWWNLHFSLLPLWRGATPLQHSIIYGTGQGITVFEIDDGLDTGMIIDAMPMDLDPAKTAGELLEELADIGSELVAKNLTGKISLRAQAGAASYAPKISRLRARVTFDCPAKQLAATVMALNPEPTAWCWANETVLRILRARAIGNYDWDAVSQTALEPGTLERRRGSVLVACAGGSRIELIEVQPAGKRPMPAVDWARGFSGSKIG
jgi:methionyl-tRNA formyltransferase